jgi:hypothetical protein
VNFILNLLILLSAGGVLFCHVLNGDVRFRLPDFFSPGTSLESPFEAYDSPNPIDGLQNPNRRIAHKSMRKLVLSGKQALPRIEHAMNNPRSIRHLHLLWTALALIRDESTVSNLIEKWADRDEIMALLTIQTAGAIGGDEALRFVLDRMQNARHPAVLKVCLAALGAIRNPDTIPEIRKYLDHHDESVCLSAVEALLQLDDVSLLPLAREKLNDPNLALKDLSLKALAVLGNPQDAALLRKTKIEDDYLKDTLDYCRKVHDYRHTAPSPKRGHLLKSIVQSDDPFFTDWVFHTILSLPPEKRDRLLLYLIRKKGGRDFIDLQIRAEMKKREIEPTPEIRACFKA